ncbi:hypothetical protein [Paraburkholderia antibiotica]|uniref:Uncharacterized protein n=1 Tax=Paraburkholderia antibiotica TaxID=2728839 RepID=A0A7Y0FFL9_9BURK|nr:hypothetical protein [Paraburkholderia antibiotica]NML34264.1 hypothetical protein [Paraburkholderia antibiotica]
MLKVLIVLILTLVLLCVAIAVPLGIFGLLVKLFGHAWRGGALAGVRSARTGTPRNVYAR